MEDKGCEIRAMSRTREQAKQTKTQEQEKETKVMMVGRRETCAPCATRDKLWRKSDVKYRYVGADSKQGKAWLARHHFSNIPVSRVCTKKAGKKSCTTFVGTSMKKGQGTTVAKPGPKGSNGRNR
jgi:hypothetical protein